MQILRINVLGLTLYGSVLPESINKYVKVLNKAINVLIFNSFL